MPDPRAIRSATEDPEERLDRYVREARAFSASHERACAFLDMCLLQDIGALFELFDQHGYSAVRRKLLGAPGG